MAERGLLLRACVPSIISKRWEPGASQAVLAAQLEDIVQAMEHAQANANSSLGRVAERASVGLGEQLTVVVCCSIRILCDVTITVVRMRNVANLNIYARPPVRASSQQA